MAHFKESKPDKNVRALTRDLLRPSLWNEGLLEKKIEAATIGCMLGVIVANMGIF